MICAGIDAGSRTIKAVLLDADGAQTVASAVADQGVDQAGRARRLFRDLLEEAGLAEGDVSSVVATGYGRKQVDFAAETITEISCQAAGVRHLVPGAASVIDVGGQDSKFIELDGDGRVRDFAMNDRCAAGTGCFLEVVASRLEVGLEELGRMALESTDPAAISSMCVVFAETEIVGLLAGGASPEDVAAGVQHSIATRISSMAGDGVRPPVIFTGGVALIPGVRRALQDVLGREVRVAPRPQMTGALGAALLAGRRSRQGTEP